MIGQNGSSKDDIKKTANRSTQRKRRTIDDIADDLFAGLDFSILDEPKRENKKKTVIKKETAKTIPVKKIDIYPPKDNVKKDTNYNLDKKIDSVLAEDKKNAKKTNTTKTKTSIFNDSIRKIKHKIDLSNRIKQKTEEKQKEENNRKEDLKNVLVAPVIEEEKKIIQSNEVKLVTQDTKKKDKKPKEKKERKEKNRRPQGSKKSFVFAMIISFIIFMCLVGVAGAGAFAIKLCEGIPELNVSDLKAPDSSTIYDNEGNKIMQIGMYLRENIEYDEMPNCLIDAFLAVEDSRYFEHIGFDIPRFTKAAISYIRNGGEFAQGGSTITMQLIKNTYFTIDDGENSTIASREGLSGIKRKMQEIVLSVELELFKKVPKKDIIAMYINKVNYGDNIRGVEKAAEYYFGKSAKNLNVSEAAFLAGIVNSPASYNPYGNIYKEYSAYYDEDTDYLQKATNRRDEVLDLMVMHGYISEEESNLAKSVKIADMLAGAADDFGETNEKYQWYIDAVIDEVEDVTGESPYEVGMNIYTNMNPYMQEYVYDMQNEVDYTNIKFPNDLCQSAIVLMDNQTGSIEALGGGRGESDSARKFNRATSAYLNPGSSMKPVVDYSLAIEKLGWATSHTITDQPYYYYNGNILVSNFDHTYYGDMKMTEALGRSQNTPAVQTLAAVVDEIGYEAVVDYLNSIGFNFEYDDFDLQFAIGGNRCLVTPVQMAGAHAIFMNDCMYVKPHTINYIEYVDGRDDYVADTVGKRALTPETAWMTAYLERYNMEGSFSSLMWYCKRDYPLYGKTGTTDWADAGVDYGIPVSATKDSWLVMQTNRYTISCWTGYDELQRGAYFTNAEYQENTKSKIVSAILDQLETHATYKDYDPYIDMEKPDGVVEINHVLGSYPYAESGGTMTTGYTSKAALEKQPLVSYSEALAYSSQFVKDVYAGPSNITCDYDGNNVHINFTVAEGGGGLLSGDSVDLSTTNYEGETTHAVGRIYFPHWVTRYIGSALPPYNYRVIIDGNITAEGTTNGYSFNAPAAGGSKCQACIWPSSGGEQSCQTFTLQ